MLAAHSTTRNLIGTIAKGAFVAAAGAAIALGGATAANASPGIVDVQSGGTVASDGMLHSDRVMALDGDQRTLANEWTDPHTVVSDICHIKHKGCLIGDRGSHTIAALSGTSDDPDSALDPDGFQADRVQGG